MRTLADLVRLQPGTALCFAALSLALGLNSAIFTVFNALWLRQSGIPNASQVRYAYVRNRTELTRVSLNDFARLSQAALQARLRLCAVTGDHGVVNDDSIEVRGEILQGDCFGLIAGPLAAGTGLAPLRQEAGAQIVISDSLWQRVFERAPSAVGSQIRLDRTSYTIVGIARSTFTGFHSPWSAVEYWVTAGDRARHLNDSWTPRWPTFPLFTPLTRLSSEYDAEAKVLGVLRSVRQTDSARRISDPRDGFVLSKTADAQLPFERNRGDAKRLAQSLMMVSAVVLLTACANLAGLLRARAVKRAQATAIRLALGARPWTLRIHAIAEGLWLGSFAGLVGLVLARPAVRLLEYSAFMSQDTTVASALTLQAPIDYRVLLFTWALSLAAGLTVAAISLWADSNADIKQLLTDAGVTQTAGRRAKRHQQVLLLPQIALTMTLLMIAIGSLTRLVKDERALRTGDPAQVALVSFDVPLPPKREQTPDRMRSFVSERTAMNRRLLDRLLQDPRFTAAALADALPFERARTWVSWEPEAGGIPLMVSRIATTPGLFETLGLRVIAGRDFTQADLVPTGDGALPRGAVISRGIAAAMSAGVYPLGHQLTFHDPDGRPTHQLEVIGVVEDAAVTSSDTPAAVYLPMQPPRYALHAVARLRVRSSSAPTDMASMARQLHGGVVLRRVASMKQVFDRMAFPRRFATAVLGSAALMGICLTMIGLYGMTSFITLSRMPELGLRAALGASPRGLQWLIVRSSASITLYGVITGAFLGYAANRVLQHYGMPSTVDSVSLMAAAGLIALAVLGACYRPARDATRLSPLEALQGRGTSTASTSWVQRPLPPASV